MNAVTEAGTIHGMMEGGQQILPRGARNLLEGMKLEQQLKESQPGVNRGRSFEVNGKELVEMSWCERTWWCYFFFPASLFQFHSQFFVFCCWI